MNGLSQNTNSNSVSVMVVDDEEMVTKTLAAYLQLETDYHISTYQSPAEALEALKKQPVDMVISDFLMPEMDGLQFLNEVKKMYPSTIRILLTGYSDKENAIKGINDVGLYQYLEKPWDNERLKLIIRNGIETKNLNSILREKICELDKVLLERDKLFEQNEMFKEELLLARNVQESLLPETLPDLGKLTFEAKYHPALEIGGDFYDVIPLAKNQIAVLIADVTGHGIQAALITVLIKSAFNTFKKQNTTPGKILTRMNKAIYGNLPLGLFVAALVVIIDTQTTKCSIANAGIPHPVLLKNDATSAEHIPVNGLLLGVADDGIFKPGTEVAFELRENESLIIFTDGLSEVEDVDNQHFEHAIVDKVTQLKGKSLSAMLDALIEEARQFSKPGYRWDDLTVLGIKAG